MILILEYLSIWFGLSVIVAAVMGPMLKRRFKEHT